MRYAAKKASQPCSDTNSDATQANGGLRPDAVEHEMRVAYALALFKAARVTLTGRRFGSR